VHWQRFSLLHAHAWRLKAAQHDIETR